MLKDSIDLAEAAAGRNLKRSEVSGYWSAKARTYISANFGAWLKLMGRKVGNFWNAFEYDDLSVIANLRQQRVLLPGPHFGIVAALAIPGLFFSLRVFPASRWIAAAIFLHMVAVLPVFVTERYRLAAVPGLLLFAAAGVRMLWQNCSSGAPQDRGRLPRVCCLAAAVLVTWPQRDPALWALKFYNSGSQALDLQDWAVAQNQLELAHTYVPAAQRSTWHSEISGLQQQNLPLAEAYYLAVLRVDSDHKAALSNLGVVALSKKKLGKRGQLFSCRARS